MSTQGDLEIFERAVGSGGRLLKAEGDRAGPKLGLLVLTFDIGRILIATDSAMDSATDGSTLTVRHGLERAGLPPGLVSLQEEEPWWRLLGHPLTAVWPGDVEWGTGARSLGPSTILKLRFREESENPRVITLAAVGGAVTVTLVGA